jgi:putative transcriptional regulator
MKNKETIYEGIVHSDLRKKVLLKINLILLPIFSLLTLFVISLSMGFTGPRAPPPEAGLVSRLLGIPDLLFWLILYIIIIPYLVINIITFISMSMYIRNYSFSVSENNIVINHGVFTKTKATIPYIRIQNVNIVSGVFDRLFKLYTVKIETAGASRGGSSTSPLQFRPEGYITGIKEPDIIEEKINAMIKKHSQIPVGLEDKIFKPEELAFDNFISYILSKMREGETLKTRIKELREKKGLSQVQLAEKVGVPIQTIKYLEEGRYNPSLTLAYKIALILEHKVEELFEFNE